MLCWGLHSCVFYIFCNDSHVPPRLRTAAVIVYFIPLYFLLCTKKCSFAFHFKMLQACDITVKEAND